MPELTREQKLELYRYMRLNRLVEEKLVNLYRQGKVVGGLYRSLGQEATSVGTAYALSKGDIVGPLIRNLGVVLVMGYSPRDVMTQYMARAHLARRAARTATSTSARPSAASSPPSRCSARSSRSWPASRSPPGCRRRTSSR